jgi:hypothetical protein
MPNFVRDRFWHDRGRRKVDFKDKAALLSEIDPQILTADGFEEALIGFATQFNKTVAVYDRKKCIAILIQRDEMSEEEAEEFFSFNVEGAFMGDRTPAFLTTFEDLEEDNGSRGQADGMDRTGVGDSADAGSGDPGLLRQAGQGE